MEGEIPMLSWLRGQGGENSKSGLKGAGCWTSVAGRVVKKHGRSNADGKPV